MKIGIDISKWQGDINLNNDIDFVIIKIGGADDGIYTDSKALVNIQKAKEKKIPFALYFFGNATTIKEAEQEAIAVYRFLYLNKIPQTVPIFYDVEGNMLKAYALDNIIEKFCDALIHFDYKNVGFYSSPDNTAHLIYLKEMSKNYLYWCAKWIDNIDDDIRLADLWQFTNKYRYDGQIVDANYILNEKLYDMMNTIYQEKKSNETIADEVIQGKWGNGVERKKLLEKSGYNYSIIQGIVNKKMNKEKKNEITVTVQKGQSLWSLAQEYLSDGSKYPIIKNYNNLNDDIIYVGQLLKIPLN